MILCIVHWTLLFQDSSLCSMLLFCRQELPDYYETISNPITLNLIKRKIKSREYTDLQDLADDLGKIVLKFLVCPCAHLKFYFFCYHWKLLEMQWAKCANFFLRNWGVVIYCSASLPVDRTSNVWISAWNILSVHVNSPFNIVKIN